MGSGETTTRLAAVHRLGLERAETRGVLVLDTPYGFQENAGILSDKLTAFFRNSLSVSAAVASYRSTAEGAVAAEKMLSAVRNARYVFAGPGSPGYALTVWKEAGLESVLRCLLTEGATITLASAAALTAGVRTLPVYEIYKAGAALGWLEGMDLTSHLGLRVVVVPHWNNQEGQGFDTTRCYMGSRRFGLLRAMLPERTGVIGVDEHTAAVIDFGMGELSVMGLGTVTLNGTEDFVLGPGESLGLEEVCAILESVAPLVTTPTDPLPDIDDPLAARSPEEIASALLALESETAAGSEGARRRLRATLVQLADLAAAGLADPASRVGGYVELLVEERSRLRGERRWEAADRIRSGLQLLGVTLRDTRSGTDWTLNNGLLPPGE